MCDLYDVDQDQILNQINDQLIPSASHFQTTSPNTIFKVELLISLELSHLPLTFMYQ